jgi:hypothetical protein
MSRWIFAMILACGLDAAAGISAHAQNQQTAPAAQSSQTQTAGAQNGQAQSGQSSTGAAQSGQSQSTPQNPPSPAMPAPPPAARATDVASPDAILAATYDVISGPAGQKRDWDRFRSLFLPGAHLVAAAKRQDGTPALFNVTPDQYAARADGYFEKSGFFEKESARHADRYGNILQVFSTYESRHDSTDEKPFARGINSFQLYYDGTRWWVVNIFWQEETPENPIPKEYSPAGK